MSNLLIFIGRLAGMLGVALGAASVGARVLGVFFVGTLQVGTLLQASRSSSTLARKGQLSLVPRHSRRFGSDRLGLASHNP